MFIHQSVNRSRPHAMNSPRIKIAQNVLFASAVDFLFLVFMLFVHTKNANNDNCIWCETHAQTQTSHIHTMNFCQHFFRLGMRTNQQQQKVEKNCRWRGANRNRIKRANMKWNERLEFHFICNAFWDSFWLFMVKGKWTWNQPNRNETNKIMKRMTVTTTTTMIEVDLAHGRWMS